MMEFRPLGSTGLDVSVLAFGAGPVSGLMTSETNAQRQLETIRRAVEAGINWFDTAATYAAGESERALGGALRHLGNPGHVHLATKIRFNATRGENFLAQARDSLRGSLERLAVRRVSLLQLHNAVTAHREDEATSLTPDDVLGPGGVCEAFERLRDEGLVLHLGLTGTGQAEAMRQVVSSRRFDVIQVPYHLLNPSAGRAMPVPFSETDYGGIASLCGELGMGVMAIRAYAGGALAGQPPSAHTHVTRFFPLDLYRRDQERAARLETLLPAGLSLPEAALRFVLSFSWISAAIIGFGESAHVDEAAKYAAAGSLPVDLMERLLTAF